MKEMVNFSNKETIKTSPDIESNIYCKDLVQDAYNEFSAVERLIDLKKLDDESFFHKIKSYDIKTFEESNNSRKKIFSQDAVEKYYPGFINKFNTIVEKIKSNQISRSDLDIEIKSLYEITKPAIAA